MENPDRRLVIEAARDPGLVGDHGHGPASVVQSPHRRRRTLDQNELVGTIGIADIQVQDAIPVEDGEGGMRKSAKQFSARNPL
jgi:hypothetical protein